MSNALLTRLVLITERKPKVQIYTHLYIHFPQCKVYTTGRVIFKDFSKWICRDASYKSPKVLPGDPPRTSEYITLKDEVVAFTARSYLDAVQELMISFREAPAPKRHLPRNSQVIFFVFSAARRHKGCLPRRNNILNVLRSNKSRRGDGASACVNLGHTEIRTSNGDVKDDFLSYVSECNISGRKHLR